MDHQRAACICTFSIVNSYFHATTRLIIVVPILTFYPDELSPEREMPKVAALSIFTSLGAEVIPCNLPYVQSGHGDEVSQIFIVKYAGNFRS